MKKKTKKIFWFNPFIVFFAFLVACGQSQFGIEVVISSNFNTIISNANNNDIEKAFTGFSFDSLNIKNNTSLKEANAFSNLAWTNVIFPNVNFVLKLLNIEKNNFVENKENNITILKNQNNDNLKTEFLYAYANNLNIGSSGQIKFGLKKLYLEFQKTDNNGFFLDNQSNTNLQIVNTQTKSATYIPNWKLRMHLNFGYWYANPAREITNLSVIQNYVKQNKNWNQIAPTTTDFWIEIDDDFTFELLYVNLEKTFKDFDEKKSMTQKTIMLNSEDVYKNQKIIPPVSILFKNKKYGFNKDVQNNIESLSEIEKEIDNGFRQQAGLNQFAKIKTQFAAFLLLSKKRSK